MESIFGTVSKHDFVESLQNGVVNAPNDILSYGIFAILITFSFVLSLPLLFFDFLLVYFTYKTVSSIPAVPFIGRSGNVFYDPPGKSRTEDHFHQVLQSISAAMNNPSFFD